MPTDDESRLRELLEPGANRRYRITITAVKLDLFSLLSRGPRSAAEVTEHYRGGDRAFEIFLNALTGMGLLEKRGGRFTNTSFAERFLVRGGKDYRGDQLVVDDADWALWGRLEETLLTGHTPLESSIFVSDSQIAERLLLGLHHDALEIAPALAARLPLGECRTLLDLGGGAGTYSVAFCARYPRLHATIFDLPSSIRVAGSVVRKSGMEERIRLVEGDFLKDPLPGGYDAVFMSNVLHGNGPEQNRELFRKVVAVLPAGGLVIVRDVIMDEDLTSPEFGAVFAVNMLLHSQEGRCYPCREISEWLEGAGFSQVEVLEPGSLLTARKSNR